MLNFTGMSEKKLSETQNLNIRHMSKQNRYFGHKSNFSIKGLYFWLLPYPFCDSIISGIGKSVYLA
jgi:hypothetical protein